MSVAYAENSSGRYNSILQFPLNEPTESATTKNLNDFIRTAGEIKTYVDIERMLQCCKFADRLLGLGIQCSAKNWGGDGEEIISSKTVILAYKFLEILIRESKIGLDRLQIDPEPDGSITYEWRLNSNYLLAVSVVEDGMLYYAGLFDDEAINGREQISIRLSDRLMSGLLKFGRYHSLGHGHFV